MNRTEGNGIGGLSEEATDRGIVAGIVIGVVTLGLALLALVAFLCYRHYLHRNVTSMNFDNPVYRKTTEDQFSLEKNRFPLPAATVGEEVSPYFYIQNHKNVYSESVRIYSKRNYNY